MDRRGALRSLAGLAAPVGLASSPLGLAVLAGCGGGGSSTPADPNQPAVERFEADRAQYLIGESATLHVTFRGLRAEVMPGSRAVVSGGTVSIGPLAETQTVGLIVTGADGSAAYRELTLPVAYRGRLRTISMGHTRALHAGAELDDGRIALFGGESETGAAAAAEVHAFDPRTLAFAKIGVLSSARDGLTATTLGDGRVLVVGAPLLSGAPRGEVFDPALGTSAAVALETFRAQHTATMLANGGILLTGGMPTPAALSCEIVDSLTLASRRLATTLNVPRRGHAATRLADGKVLIYGGSSLTGEPAPPELFDPVTETFALLPTNPVDTVTQRIGHALVRDRSGATHVLGGEDAANGVPTFSAMSMARGATGFDAIAAMPRARSWLTASPLSDGRVLVAGGFADRTTSALQAACDLLDPAALAWSTGPALATPRVLHTAHRLYTGQVLIVGGNDAAGAVIGTAELFD